MKKKKFNLTFIKLSVTALNRNMMVSILGGITGDPDNPVTDDPESNGCDIIGGTKDSKAVDDMLCKSTPGAIGDPCFA